MYGAHMNMSLLDVNNNNNNNNNNNHNNHNNHNNNNHNNNNNAFLSQGYGMYGQVMLFSLGRQII